MGQKVNPIGFRLGISKTWRSTWYANRDFPALLKEDELLRKYLKARLGHAAIADIRIERKPGKVVVTIHTGRPGVVIGKKGAEVDQLYVKHAIVNGGPMLKRWMPAAMGRATPIHKRTSHIEIIVAERD